MKKLIIIAVGIFITSTGLFAQTKAGKADTTKHTTFYSCPKHPEMTSYEPGKCTKCGMELNLSGKEQMKSSQSKSYICPVHMDVASHDPGKCPKCGKKLNLSPKEQMKAEVTKMYTCPMHPNVALDKDGVCAKCGTALVEKKQKKS
jgi:uncharacterized paraquat-inducible protein A